MSKGKNKKIIILLNKELEMYETEKKKLEEIEDKLIKQIEDVRKRKLVLAGALSAVNRMIETND